jgi:hypothetical protein
MARRFLTSSSFKPLCIFVSSLKGQHSELGAPAKRKDLPFRRSWPCSVRLETISRSIESNLVLDPRLVPNSLVLYSFAIVFSATRAASGCRVLNVLQQAGVFGTKVGVPFGSKVVMLGSASLVAVAVRRGVEVMFFRHFWSGGRKIRGVRKGFLKRGRSTKGRLTLGLCCKTSSCGRFFERGGWRKVKSGGLWEQGGFSRLPDRFVFLDKTLHQARKF